MAKRVTVELMDDMHPDEVAAETISFALDGVSYEIDLSDKNAASMRTKMKPFIDAGRRTGRAPRGSGTVRVAARDDLDAIRVWAKGKGKKVAARGRIAHDTISAYDAEKAKPASVKPAKAAPQKDPVTDDASKMPAFSN